MIDRDVTNILFPGSKTIGEPKPDTTAKSSSNWYHYPPKFGEFNRDISLPCVMLKPTSIVDGLLSTHQLASIVGQSKIGKSSLAMQLAFCVQNGFDFLDYSTQPCDVIYIDFEHQNYEIYERFNNLRRHFNYSKGLSPYILPIDGNDIYNEDSLVEVCDQCRDFIDKNPDINLIIFDSFSSFVTGDSNDPVIAQTYLEMLQYLARDRRDVSVVYTQTSAKTGPANPNDIIYSAGGNGIHRKLSDVALTINRTSNGSGRYIINTLDSSPRTVSCAFGKNTDFVFNFKKDITKEVTA